MKRSVWAALATALAIPAFGLSLRYRRARVVSTASMSKTHLGKSPPRPPYKGVATESVYVPMRDGADFTAWDHGDARQTSVVQ
jgi:hypothetical protein